MKTKTYRTQIIIVLTIFVGTLFISCKNDIETINRITGSSELPNFMVTDLETSFSDSGIVRVKIYAPELVRFDKPDKKYDEYPKGINVEFYNESMQKTGSLKCKYAKYLITEELWVTKNDVEVNNTEKSERINTELLYWDMKKELIYSDKFVRITTPDEILFGDGFESNQDFSKWKIIKPTGTISIKDE